MEQGPDELSEREGSRSEELERLTNEPLNRDAPQGDASNADEDDAPEAGE